MKIGLHLPKYCENKSGLLLCEMGEHENGLSRPVLYRCTGVYTEHCCTVQVCTHLYCTGVQVCTQNTVYTTQASMACTVQLCTQNTEYGLSRPVLYRCVHRTLSTTQPSSFP